MRVMLQALDEVSTSSMILNPEYVFPTIDFERLDSAVKKKSDSQIVEQCKLYFPEYGLAILFDDKRMIFFGKPGDEKASTLIYPLIYFITYKTRLNYNMYTIPGPDSPKLLDDVVEVKQVLFNLKSRLIKEIRHGQESRYHHHSEHQQLEISKDEVRNFLSALNDNLYLAIAYYLIGCENSRYFLIEYYKALEVIKNYFVSEEDMKEQLQPLGYNWSDYKKLKKYANDEQKPLDIGRHAPKKDVPLRVINVKPLLEEPKSKELFSESTRICRGTINTFFEYLTNRK